MSIGEPKMPAGVDQGSDAEKPKEKKIFMGELDRDGYTRLEGAWSGMFNGMREVENIMHDGGITEEDLNAFKRVLRGVTLYMNEYRNEQQHTVAEEEYKKIKALEKQLREMKGTTEDVG